jgi:hypothetical protein
MTATTTVANNTETLEDKTTMVDVDVISSDTTPEPEAPADGKDTTTETTAVLATAVFDADAILRKVAKDGKADRNAFAMAISKVACQSNHSLSELSELLETLSALDSSGDLAQITGFSGDDLKITNKVARHYLAGSISRSLDEQHNALRVDLCEDNNGHGLYLEAGPLGHAGLGLGIVSKETKNGKTTVKRTGAGVYFRADHIMSSAVVASSACAA